MIQKGIRELIKLETAYFLHGWYHYLHIYSQPGILTRSNIKLNIYYFSKPALNFEKCTCPQKDLATCLLGAINSCNKSQHQFSNLPLKIFSPTKIESLLFQKCVEKYEVVERGNFN